MYTLQKLNVVKVVDSEEKRDVLLAKGFIMVKEQKGKKLLKKPTVSKDGGDRDAGDGTERETGETALAAGDAGDAGV